MKVSDVKIGKRFRKNLGDIDSLASSISEVGLLHPIVVDGENNLIVGYRRLKAFEKLEKTEIPHRTVNTLQDALKTLAERDENNCREDFTPEEKLSLAEALERIEKKESQKRQYEGYKKGGKTAGRGRKNSSPQNLGKAIDRKSKEISRKVAKSIGWSGETLRKAQEIASAAKENPIVYGDLVDKMNKSGKVDPAYKEYKKRKKLQEAQIATENVSLPTSVVTVHGDFADRMEELDDNSVDLIFTDPPYDEENIPLYGKLAEIASRKLKSGGSLIAYAGHYALPEIMTDMGKHLRYWWIIALEHSGASARLPGKWIFVEWKPLLWYVKDGRSSNEYVSDLFKSKQPDKTEHEWQQDISEAKYYIEQLTKLGDLIVDPFLGSGTTAIAASGSGRRAWGCDNDKSRLEIAEARIKQCLNQ